MNIYITGATGHIGRRLIGLGCLPLACDVTDMLDTEKAIAHLDPSNSLVLHLASVSNVDECENNREKAWKVNYRGTRHVAWSCHNNKIGMAFLSTDHIFNGKRGPYREDYRYYHRNLLGQFETPVNYYGLTKMTAEAIAVALPFKIIRTSYNFDFYRFEAQEISPDYPTFLCRSFMYAGHLAQSLKLYMDRFFEMPDALNISGSETVSWYEFALAYASVFGISKDRIHPRKKEIKRPRTTKDAYDYAPRPHKAGLVTTLSKKLGFPQYSYLDGLKQMKEEPDHKDG